MRIAVYSGSFNPLHIGHQAIMEYLTREKGFDWVYLVVSPKNPLKDSISAESGEARYNAAVEAVRRHPELHVWVDDIELKKREPENDFTLVMGADNLSSIRRWRDFPRLLSEYGVAVYPRKGFDIKSLRDTLINECTEFPASYVLDAAESGSDLLMLEDASHRLYKIQLIDAPIIDISSTRIREGLAAGEDMSEWLM